MSRFLRWLALVEMAVMAAVFVNDAWLAVFIIVAGWVIFSAFYGVDSTAS